jgi:hypothetical protein
MCGSGQRCAGTMLAMQRVISVLFTWCFLLLVSFCQPKVLAVECFSSPISTVMVSLRHGKDSKDPIRPWLYKPLFGEIREMQDDPKNHDSSASAVSRKASTRTSAFVMATALRWRGGAGGSPASPLAPVLIPFSYLRKLPAFVAQSKTRCAITLCISILGECVSTSLNKYSKVHQSPRALLAAMGLYLMTYVMQNKVDPSTIHRLIQLFIMCFALFSPTSSSRTVLWVSTCPWQRLKWGWRTRSGRHSGRWSFPLSGSCSSAKAATPASSRACS